MRRIILFIFLISGILTIASGDVLAQDFERMRQEIRERQSKARSDIEFLRNEINRIESRLSQSSTEYDQRYRQFEQLEREINLRDQILARLQEEQDDIAEELSVLERAFQQYSKELEDMIENYHSVLRHLYMHGRESEVVLLLTAGSLNEMQVKSYYLRKFEQYRESQFIQVQNSQELIKEKEQEMIEAKVRNDSSLAEARRERNTLASRKSEQEKLITELQRDRTALEQQLAQSRTQVDQLNQLITNLIAEDERVRREEEARYQQLERERLIRLAEAEKIENAREREREIARFSEPIRRPDTITLTPEQMGQIGTKFRSSRGRIPWPVDEGVIVTRFGNIVDPVYRTVIPNYGIEISTAPRSQVRAVHDGFITDVVDVHGFDTMIIVNHGDYITAYGNLTQSNVRRNSVVRAGDVIGLSGDDNSYKGSVVFFLIRDGNRNVDPQQWITSRPGPVN